MKTLGWAVALLATAAIARADGVTWGSDYAKGLEQAKKDGKLLHVHFFADWCGPCKAMDKEVFHDAEVAKYLDANFVNVLIDVDKDKAIAEKFKVRGIPDSRVLDGSEHELLHVVGYRTEFFDQMKSLAEVSGVEKALKENPTNVDTLLQAEEVYVKLGRLEDAAAILVRALEADPENKSGKKMELYYKLGLTHQKLDHKEECNAAWAEVARMDPTNEKGFIDDIQFSLCQKQCDDEDWLSAERSLGEFLKQYPSCEHVADAKFLVGMAQFFNEKKDEAISTWNDLIRSYPNTPAAKKAEKNLKYAEKKTKKQ